MSALTGNAINTSYQGLIKFDDNGTVLPTTLKTLTDGTGGTLPLSISQIETKFTSGSLVDFTGTTVTGLPADTNTTYDLTSAQNLTNVDITLTGSDATLDTVQLTAGTNITLTEAAGSITIDAAGGGAAGLISGGTGIGSMKNDAALVTTAPITLGLNDIVIGDNCSLTSTTTNTYYTGQNIIIGKDNNMNKTVDYSFLLSSGRGVMMGTENAAIMGAGGSPVVIGYKNTSTTADAYVILGDNNTGSGNSTIIGNGNVSNIGQSIAIGSGVSNTSGYGSTSIGGGSWAKGGGFGTGSTTLGNYAQSEGGGSVAVGSSAHAKALNSIAIGSFTRVSAVANTGCIVIGQAAEVTATVVDAVAIGRAVIADKNATVSLTELEVQLVGGGITMYSPNGTEYKLTVSDAGALVIS